MPRGFRDILPVEARELHAIEHLLMTAFAAHGYVPLEPPAVELADGLALDPRRLMRFVDRDGRLLALRPDLTTAVARVVARRYAESGGALRLSYFTPVFREETSMRGSEREYDQAGVELIADGGARADAEVIALLAYALERCGLTQADIDVGHAGYVAGFLDELPAEARDAAQAAVLRGDLVGVVHVARAAGLPDARLEALQRGVRHRAADLDGVRAGAPDASLRAIDELEALAPLLDAAGARSRVRFDLGLLPTFAYYSGVVFQATAEGVGFPVASGGRYDGLLERFGTPRPATGFGIAVPHLHQAMVTAGWRVADDLPLVVLEPSDDDALTLGVAAALRAQGLAVAVGHVAETAGRATVTVRAAADGRVEHDGGPVDVAMFAARVGVRQ